MVNKFLQTEAWATKGECCFKVDVDYGRSINKYILSPYCVPTSVLGHMRDKGYISQSFGGDRINELYAIETETGTGGLKMEQDISNKNIDRNCRTCAHRS